MPKIDLDQVKKNEKHSIQPKNNIIVPQGKEKGVFTSYSRGDSISCYNRFYHYDYIMYQAIIVPYCIDAYLDMCT